MEWEDSNKKKEKGNRIVEEAEEEGGEVVEEVEGEEEKKEERRQMFVTTVDKLDTGGDFVLTTNVSDVVDEDICPMIVQITIWDRTWQE
jgi:hypothetical protein